MPCKFIAFKARSKRSASVFDVFSIWSFLFFLLKRQSVKQKFTPSCLCGSNFSCTMYRSPPRQKQESLWVCAGPEWAQGRRPRPGAHYDAEGWRVSRGCTVSIWGWWDRGDGQPQPGQRITSWQWLSHTTSGVVVMANSQSAWLGAVRATQGHWQWHHASRCPAPSGTTVYIQTCVVRVFHLRFLK